MICVYPADCTDFSTGGNGISAPLSAEVMEMLNGEYELKLAHPIDDAGGGRFFLFYSIPIPAVK